MELFTSDISESPIALPRIVKDLGAGATSTSFRKPNCLSQITEIPDMNPSWNTDIMKTPESRNVK